MPTDDPEVFSPPVPPEADWLPASERQAADDAMGFREYFEDAFVPLGGVNVPIKDCHRDICEEVERALLGLDRNADGSARYEFYIINVPPRVGKTKIMEGAVTWFDGIFPKAQWIWTSHTNPLATASCRHIQQVFKEEWYRTIFPNFRLGNMEQTDNFNTSEGGTFKADGVNAMLTGFGAGDKAAAGGGIVIDDPSDPNKSLSKIEVEAQVNWFENVILRRRNSDLWTPIFLIQQRVGGDDLSGHVLKTYPEKTKHLVFPGMLREGEEDEESAFPETISTKTLKKLREVNKFVFYSQIQQAPIVVGGNVIRIDDFKYFDPNTPMKFEWLGMYADTAWKTKEANDYSVVAVAGRMNGGCYLLDIARGKWESPEMVEVLRRMWGKWKALAHVRKTWLRKLMIEDASSGTYAIQQLRREGIPVVAVVRSKDKLTRVEDVLPLIAAGCFHVNKELPHLNDFLEECASFRRDGKHKHDDFVDCAADALLDTLGKPMSIFDVMGQRPKGR